MSGSLTRRSFVVALAGTLGLPATLRAGIAQVRPATPSDASLSPAEMAVFALTAQAVTGVADLRYDYARYHAYHAKRDPRRLDAYRRYANAISDRAGGDLQALLRYPKADQLQAVHAVREITRQDEEIEKFVFQDTLMVFRMNDAWLQLGYESWPGEARGLDSYRVPLTEGGRR